MKKFDPLHYPNINFSVVENYHRRAKIKYKSQRMHRGFDDTETWNLDRTIMCFILPRIKRFREVTKTYPAEFETFEEWEAVLDKIIKALEFLTDDDNFSSDESPKYEEDLKLLWKYFFDLWW